MFLNLLIVLAVCRLLFHVTSCSHSLLRMDTGLEQSIFQKAVATHFLVAKAAQPKDAAMVLGRLHIQVMILWRECVKTVLCSFRSSLCKCSVVSSEAVSMPTKLAEIYYVNSELIVLYKHFMFQLRSV